MSEIKLIQGDCLEVMKSIPDKSIDAIITDLPYGTTACSWDEIIPFVPMWERVKKINKGVFITTASQPFTSKLVVSNIENFKYQWYWRKTKATGFLDAKRRPLNEIEDILVFCYGSAIYNPQMQNGLKHKNGISHGTKINDTVYSKFNTTGTHETNEYYPKRLLDFTHETNPLHNTQKPVALYEYLIRTYTNEGDTVLDFTCGSGTTGVACVNTNRNCILIDNDSHWIDVSAKRIHDAQQQMRLEF